MNSLEITEREGRLFIRLRVTPKAKRDRVTGVHAGALKLQVKDPPEKGRANEGVLRLLSKTLSIPAKEIELVSGHASQDKRVAISAFTGGATELRNMLSHSAGQEKK